MALTQAQAQDWLAAQRCYIELLDGLPSGTLSPRRRAFFLANRAFVRLKLGRFDLALADANDALSLEDRRPTTFWRKVQALHGLERTQEADVRPPPPRCTPAQPRPCPAPFLTPIAPPTTTQELVTAALTQADVKKETDKFWQKIKERAAKVALAGAVAAPAAAGGALAAAEAAAVVAEAVAEGPVAAPAAAGGALAAAEAAAEQVEAAAEAGAPNGPPSPVGSSGELGTGALSTTTHAAGHPGRSSQLNGAALAAQHVQAKDTD